MNGVDLYVENHGSIFLLRAVTDRGRGWLDENVGNEETQTWAGAIVVEHRYIEDIVHGALGDGLMVA